MVILYSKKYNVSLYTSVGIILSVFIFLYLIYKLSKFYKVSFWRFFYFFPIIIIITYLFGSYIYILLNFKIIIPLSKVDSKIERFKWIDVVFYSMMVSFFVLGIFLLL